MELITKILLLLMIFTCLEISNCMVIPEKHIEETLNPEESITEAKIQHKSLDSEDLDLKDDPNSTPFSQILTEEPKVDPTHKIEIETNSTFLNESYCNNCKNIEDNTTPNAIVQEISTPSLIIHNITGRIIRPENEMPNRNIISENHIKQTLHQNRIQNEEIVILPPTINYKQEIKNIMDAQDIPDLEVRKSIMTELLDVDYPKNIRTDYLSNNIEKVKEITRTVEETPLVNSTASTGIDNKMPLLKDSKSQPIIETMKTIPLKLNKTEEMKSERILSQTVVDKNVNNDSSINDKVKSEKNLNLKKKSRQLDVFDLPTNTDKTEEKIIINTNISGENKTEEQIQNEEDDVFFANVIEPSKSQKSVFHLKIDTNAPFEILEKDRLVKWMDRHANGTKINIDEQSDHEDNSTMKISEEKIIKTIETTGRNSNVAIEIEQTEILNSNSSLNEEKLTDFESSESNISVGDNVFETVTLVSITNEAEAGTSENSNVESDKSSSNIETIPIVVNNESETLDINLFEDNSRNMGRQNVLDKLIAEVPNEFKNVENLQQTWNESVSKPKEEDLQQENMVVTPFLEITESTTIIPDRDEINQGSLIKKEGKQNQNLESVLLNSSEENSSESKEEMEFNKDIPKKNSSEENSSKSKQHDLKNKTEVTKKDSSEENSSESKEKSKQESSEESKKHKKNKDKKVKHEKLNNQKYQNNISFIESSTTVPDEGVIDIRINLNDEQNKTDSISNESTEILIPKGRSLDLSAVAEKNMLNKKKAHHDVHRKSVDENSPNVETNTQKNQDFSSALQPNPSLKVFLPSFQEKIVLPLFFETTTLLPLKIFNNDSKKISVEVLKSSENSEISVDADILNEIVSSDDAIASASIGKASNHQENINNSTISYLLSSTVVVMIVGIIMGTFYKYRGKQGTLNIELEERKNGKNKDNTTEDESLHEISISTPSNSDDNSSQSNTLLPITPTIKSDEKNLPLNVSTALLKTSTTVLNELNSNNITKTDARE